MIHFESDQLRRYYLDNILDFNDVVLRYPRTKIEFTGRRFFIGLSDGLFRIFTFLLTDLGIFCTIRLLFIRIRRLVCSNLHLMFWLIAASSSSNSQQN